jgi:hypothetical protein
MAPGGINLFLGGHMKRSSALTLAQMQGRPGPVPDQRTHTILWRDETRRRTTIALTCLIILSAIGVLFSPGKASAATVTQSGQVFASVGNSSVNIYDPASGNLLNTLNDGTNESYTAGGAFDVNNNFFVADDLNGQISMYNSSGQLQPLFASGLTNPLSLAFDSTGNLYVGQQTTPYIAVFNPGGLRQPDIGPLATELYGVDWIALAADECTIYYTTEGTDVLGYNKCTHTQLPMLNVTPFTGANAFQLQILANGDVLVADSGSVILLDPSGNVLQTYSCASLPGCQGQLFAVNLDPNGTSFWTGDSFGGDIWKVDIATGNVLQTIQTHSGALYGLTVANQIEVAAAPPVVVAASTALAVTPVSGHFLHPTPVSAVLTDSVTFAPISGELVAFNLNGAEACTGTTDATGTATCVITPGEAASSYTLTASFAGDSAHATPVGSSSTSSSFVVAPDTSTLTYTGATAAVNGQGVTLSGILTTDNPSAGTPLLSKVVTFTVGAGPSAQSCSGITDATGAVSCAITSVDQSVSPATVTASFAGDVYDSVASASASMTVTTPTQLTVSPDTSAYSVPTTVSAVLKTTGGDLAVANEPVTFSLNGTQTCTATTVTDGSASCSITPNEQAATYTLTASFGGDATTPSPLLSTTGSANLMVTPDATTLTYTGATTAVNTHAVTLSGVLTTGPASAPSPVSGQSVVMTLGTGSTAQTCTATTDLSGAASCSIANVSQTVGPVPVTAVYGGTPYDAASSGTSSVTVGNPPPSPVSLTVNAGSGDFADATTVSAVLTNLTTSSGVPGEPVIFKLNGIQTCTGTTNASGVASCSLTPNESAAPYTLTASFAGDTNPLPQLLPANGSASFVVTLEETSLTYTGSTSAVNGSSMTMSGVLSTDDPAPGTTLAARSVVFTLGTGSSAQSCSATTSPSGAAACTIASVHQTLGTESVTAGFMGDATYRPAFATSSATIKTPTALTVSAATGKSGSSTTVTATLTNAATGTTLSGEPVTFTLGGAQVCTGTTDANGNASCSLTPTETAGSYSLTAAFTGDTSASPQLIASSGANNFVVTPAASTILSTGATYAVTGTTLTLSAVLTTNVPQANTPVSGRSVTLTLGSGKTAQSCTATSNSTGLASCTIASVTQVAGSVPVTVSFAGDASYLSSSNSATEIVASPPSSGAFVIGDVSAGHPTNGTSVNFWGAQLWKNNVFSGVNNSPPAMKGYIDNPGGYSCGATWTSDPGNSSHPPSTIPSEMVVIVSSKITQSGSNISGVITHMVIVSVNPGYAGNPGHDGTGTIVHTIC